MKKNIKHIFTVCALAATLQGCIFVAGAAAGAAAIAVVYDHRSVKNTLQDTHTANKISDRFKTVPGLRENSHVEVTVFNEIALLTGETSDPQARLAAEEIAKSTPGVYKVYNQITIQGPTSSLTRTSDSWITTKIRAEMLAADNLKSSSIKVITENGVVYLMGIVTPQQGDSAVEIARQVSGVQKVVKVFQYRKAS